VLQLARPGLWIMGALLLALLIVVGGLLPGPVVKSVSAWDKLEHVGAYLVLTLWLAGMVERPRYPAAAAAALLLGAAVEAGQVLLTETRHGDLLDLVANAIGVALALTAAYLGFGGWAQRAERWLGFVRAE